MERMGWSPFRDLMTMQEQMNRLLQDTLSCFGTGVELTQRTWTPPADIYETREVIILSVELPGIDRQDIHVELQGNTLTLRGERRRTLDQTAEGHYHCRERIYGPFYRSFTFSAPLDQAQVNAHYKDGVLEIVISKEETDSLRQIQIDLL
ncbi:MAG: Hsp20/alpha crystallin family protein [Nitrospinota bacterium]|nr:MAG: Hsp20/alpha crystallin family protein [Nitrospinota bacterium]